MKLRIRVAAILALLLAGSLPSVGQTSITSLSSITDADGHYVITADITGGTPGVTTFNGTLDAAIDPDTKMPYRIKNLSAPLFTTLTGPVKNLVLENVSISGGDASGNTGAIACTANGSARIYNIGILSGSVGGTAYTGGLVGLLDGTARVINCYSYATISSGSNVGGIVGYNNVATTSANLKTMVFGCMFYGDITSGSNKAPIYNGNIITNVSTGTGTNNKGVSNFNYFRAEADYVQNRQINTYNCALMAESRFLQRFEFFRHILNSHREVAAWWVTGNRADTALIMKWVMLPDSIGSSHPYPILKKWGKYPSVVNLDAAHATTGKARNQGGKLGELTVHIQMGSGGAQFAPPTGAAIAMANANNDTVLVITDKDTAHFNFNYYKVQLPYYNEVGTKNYTGNRVVTGWKIVSITGGTPDPFTTGADVTFDANGNITSTPYNFADRHCTNKDLYSESKRVFNQGAYWDVPEGVSAITIEPYWAKAAYCADDYADVVYNKDMGTPYNVPTVGEGQIYTNGSTYSINGDDQVVYTNTYKDNGTINKTGIINAMNAVFSGVAENTSNTHSVYDYAIVFVGNAHNIGISSNSAKRPYTLMSIDLDHDNEPDYCYILRFNSRNKVHPVRVDFINIPGLGMAQKSTGGTGTYNFGIMQPLGWFESTNTSLFRETQFEYDNSSRVASPYILQGGVMEQWVLGQSGGHSDKTTYFHVGGNVWFKEFHRGSHQDKDYNTNHTPVSVTGGDFDQFYLTGLYTGNVTSYNDNAECYVNGGRFGTIAGAGMEGIGNPSTHANGNITWIIDNADINEFYAGGINAAKPVEGNLKTIINNSHVNLFCGGPKFGDMNSERTVNTTATNCHFVLYFGAGYGGNSYNRYPPYNYNSVMNINWNKWINGEQQSTDNDHPADPNYEGFQHHYSSTYDGVDTRIDYQFIPMSGNANNCARLWIEYVKFSLAKTRNVISTLTNCTIDSNFYGGGSLGKVEGNVESILDGCIVKGNVFGAGYSATIPKVPVMNLGGFIDEPYYDQNLGNYLPATFPDTVHYTWNTTSVINASTAVDNDAHILYTTEDLNTLGSVNGNATLTLKGTTIVGTVGNNKTGNVYGGGDESSVTGTGNTTVILEEGVTVLGNVYGGGNKGAVGGNSEVKISDE